MGETVVGILAEFAAGRMSEDTAVSLLTSALGGWRVEWTGRGVEIAEPEHLAVIATVAPEGLTPHESVTIPLGVLDAAGKMLAVFDGSASTMSKVASALLRELRAAEKWAEEAGCSAEFAQERDIARTCMSEENAIRYAIQQCSGRRR